MIKMLGTAQLLAYEKIRDNILNGTYPGGMKLIESRLAEEIGVSRTPVREAIQRLEQEGLIKRKKVYKPTETDLRHLFEMRTLIECHATKMAASFMLEDNIEALKSTIMTAKVGNQTEVVQANKEFHDLIVRESRNPIMIDTVDNMQSIIYLFSRAVVLYKRPFLIEEHQLIYEAIANRDPIQASKLMEDHLKADFDFSLDIV